MVTDKKNITQATTQAVIEPVKKQYRHWQWPQVKAALGLEMSQQVQGQSLADLH